MKLCTGAWVAPKSLNNLALALTVNARPGFPARKTVYMNSA